MRSQVRHTKDRFLGKMPRFM